VERRRIERRDRGGRRQSDGLPPARVLLIEPHEDTRFLYTCLFEESGYAVYSVGEGVAAMEVARRRLPDVVITEIAVPGADGLEILRMLRDDPLTSTIPAVVVTSFLHFDIPARARASGAVLVLEKPAEPHVVLEEVDALVMGTPRERFIGRHLTRSLLTLRELGTRCRSDERARDRIRAVIDRLQVAVVALDPHGHCVSVSPGASRLTGYSRGELLRMSMLDPAIAANISFLRNGEAPPGAAPPAELTIRDKNGAVMQVQTAFATLLPDLHATAFAPSPRSGTPA
jgi:PAS domain S-box-containing protein